MDCRKYSEPTQKSTALLRLTVLACIVCGLLPCIFVVLAHYKPSGLLTTRPINMPVYRQVQAEGYRMPEAARHSTPRFAAGFSGAGLPHFHYREGSLKAATEA